MLTATVMSPFSTPAVYVLRYVDLFGVRLLEPSEEATRGPRHREPFNRVGSSANVER